MKSNKILIALALSVLAFSVLAGCGAGDVFDGIAGGGATAQMAPAAPAPAAAPMAPTTPAPAAGAPGSFFAGDMAVAEQQWDRYSSAYDAPGGHFDILDRIVIKNANISMETPHFENTTHTVEAIITSHGGFIERSERWSFHMHDREFWNANLTLRVPAEFFDSANTAIMALGHITNFSTFSEDVTMEFRDVEGRLDIRRQEERRILMMLANTDSLEDLIALEARLADIRIIMEGYQRRMTEIDHLASFSTIDLFIREVTEEGGIMPTWDDFPGRLASAFGGSVSFTFSLIEGFVVLIATITLPLLILSSPVLIAVLVLRKIKKNKQPST